MVGGKLRQGFSGQRIVVIPRAVVRQMRRHPLLVQFLPTDVGYFPCASRHLRERRVGIDQTIFIYCIKGAGWCEIDGRHTAVGSGDLLVIPAGVPHVYGADDTQPWTILWVHAVGAAMNAFLGELGVDGEHPIIDVGLRAPVQSLFEEILSIVEAGYSQVHLIQAAHALGHLLAVLIGENRAVRQPGSGSRYNIEHSIVYMEQHLGKSLKLQTLTDVAHLARSQYTLLFKRRTGYAPMDYFHRLKMHRACQLLDRTDLSVKAIAAMLGYADQLYFSRQFKTVNEISPLAYRRRRKG